MEINFTEFQFIMLLVLNIWSLEKESFENVLRKKYGQLRMNTIYENVCLRFFFVFAEKLSH